MEAAVLRQFGARAGTDPRRDALAGNPARCSCAWTQSGLCGTDLKVIDGALPGLRPTGDPRTRSGRRDRRRRQILPAGLSVACYLYEPCGHCRWCALAVARRCTMSARSAGRALPRRWTCRPHLVMREENVLPVRRNRPGARSRHGGCGRHAVASYSASERGCSQEAPGDHRRRRPRPERDPDCARSRGCPLQSVDPAEVARARALELGAELAVSRQGRRPRCGSGAMAAWTWASRRPVDPMASWRLRPNVRAGGRIVCCGYGADTHHDVASMFLVLSEISLLGSRASARDDVRAALDAVQ